MRKTVLFSLLLAASLYGQAKTGELTPQEDARMDQKTVKEKVAKPAEKRPATKKRKPRIRHT